MIFEYSRNYKNKIFKNIKLLIINIFYILIIVINKIKVINGKVN